MRTWLAALLLGTIAILSGAGDCAAQTPVLTHRNDNSRDALNSSETILNTTNVNATQFGKLFSVPISGAVYAQPLYAPNVMFPGNVTHNVVIVATETDLVYAFDADGVSKTPLWTANLLDSAHGGITGESQLTAGKSITCTNIQPNLGVSATPVIDMTTQPTPTIFVEAWSVSNSIFIHRLHALDITTGLERSQSPVVVTASVSGTGDGSQNGVLAFNPAQHNARPGLLLVNGVVYIAYASMCDVSPYHGWIMAYDENTLTQKSVFVTTPNGGMGGIWMSQAGMAADANGFIYTPTGNGTFDTSGTVADFGDTLLKLSTIDSNKNNGILSVADYFTPFDQASLSANDRDLASGGAMLLPDQPGSFPHQVVQGGKIGRVYVVNRDQMTSNPSSPSQPEHYCTLCTSTDNQIIEESADNYISGIFGAPAYWNNNVYYWGSSSTLTSIPIVNGLLNFAGASSGATSGGFPGPGPAISSNGNTTGTAIVWAITPSGLAAYDAENLSNLLWTSTQAGGNRDQAGPYVFFSVPTITNGKMYVGTGSELDVYGLLPTITPSTVTLRAGQTQQFLAPLPNTVWMISPAGAGTISGAGLYTAPATITTSETVTVTATTPGELAVATVVLLPTAASGGSTAAFVNFDTATQGNWMGVYGAGGYSLANAGQSLPTYDESFSMGSQATWTYASETSDPRALQTDNQGDRIAAAWYGTTSFNMNLNFTDGQTHQVAFYAVDWDGKGRTETFQIYDASPAQKGLLEQRTISSFGNGTYLVFNISGQVQVTVTMNAGPNALVNGVFFAAGSGTSTPSATVSFIGTDLTTEGKWSGTYGADGYYASPSIQSPPSYAYFALQGNSSWTWATTTSDPRALQFPSGSIASTWYTTTTFSVTVDLTDGNTHQVAIYALDWDRQGRSETIVIRDAATGTALDTRTISNFGNGVWLVWSVNGNVNISVTQTGGPNATISGIFFGTIAGSQPVLSITKSHGGNFTQGQQNAAYTVTVSNAANAAATSGVVTVSETLPSGLALVSMSGTGWTCTTGTASCTRSDALNSGSSYSAITVAVNVGASATSPQVNQVTVTGGGAASASASDSTVIATPVLSITKSHSGNFTQGQQNATYTVTVSNAANAAATSGAVTVNETLPSGLALVSMSGAGWTCSMGTSSCTRSDALSAGGSYPAITVTVNVGASAASPQVNQVSVAGGGAPTASASDSTVIATPVLSIAKSHSGNFTQGQQNAIYTVTVSNAANAAATNGAVTVGETLPSGLTLVSMSGTGWTCSMGTASCMRSDVLSAGSSYPAITVTVNVGASAASPQVNQVSVAGGGSANASASDSTIINTSPTLSITKAHSGSFSQGQQNATYTVTVSNAMNAEATIGAVTVNETLPSGLTLVSLSGTGWTCSTGTTSCTRSDALSAGSSYPAITVTVNVGASAASPQVNQVSVAGGGSATASASDSTVIATAVLNITKTHSGNFAQGQQNATYTVTVSNAANAAPTSGAVTVSETVPSGLTLVSMSGTGWTCSTSTSSCTRSDALSAGGSYPAITVTVNVGASVASPQVNQVSVTGGGSATASASDSTVIATAVLSITKAHSGNFAQGQQNATYMVTVSNAANTAPTSGAVTVNETLPSGLALVSMNGTGWTCMTSTASCTRSDALSAGSSYPAITVTVNVGASAPSPQVNQVSVTGGGSANASASDSTVITTTSGGGSGNSATYVQTDTTTQGSWQGTYGSDGYFLANVATELPPSYASFAVQNEINYTWSPSTSDPRALENPGGGSGIAAAWYSPSSFTMTVNVSDGKTHQFAVYAMDWDRGGRTETVKITDATTGNILDTRTLSNFVNGEYLVWNISGNIKITVTDVAGPNAVVSGVFFAPGASGGSGPETVSVTPSSTTLAAGGQQQFTAVVTNGTSQNVTWAIQSVVPAGASSGNFSTTTAGLYTAPSSVTSVETITVAATSADGTATGTATITVNPPGSAGTSAVYVKTDTSTEGSWQGVYGADGYVLANVTAQVLPAYATFGLQGQINYTWNPATSDPRALQVPGSASGIAAAWYNPGSFTMATNFTDGNMHQFALYALDWDGGGRAETIQISDAVSGAVLDSRTIANFKNGVYVVWNVSGNVKITVSKTAGSNAVVSGVFFGQ